MTADSVEQVCIRTSRFGEVSVLPERLLTFVAPILGFSQHKEFALLDHHDDSPFKWLQAIADPDLAFVVTMPALFELDYEFMLPEEAVQLLGLKTPEEVLVLTLVTIPEENPVKMTTNLLGPIVVNLTTRQAMQLILQDSERFSTKVRLIPDEQLQQPEQTAGSTVSSSHEAG